MIYAIIADHPEGCRMTCTKDGIRTAMPCSLCLCKNEKLSDMKDDSSYRTEELCMRKLLEARTDQSVLIEYSMHNVKPFFFGFNGTKDTVYGNPYMSVMIETMHNVELGIWAHLISALRSSTRKRLLILLDERLQQIKSGTTIPGFRIPGSTDTTYFLSGANYHAHEHRSIIQVICAVIEGILDRETCKLFMQFYNWYLFACRKISYTEHDLVELKLKTEKLVSEIIRKYGKIQTSEWNIPKIHALKHYPEAIRRAGVPAEYCADLWESLHIGLVKMPFKGGNNRNCTSHILKMSIRRELMSKIGNIYEQELGGEQKCTIMKRVRF
jgi:Plavaka transposase